ncbi:alpha-galactosidase [Paenibacillus fonticola]|uniref:alpha-galactosidase n=1 Tax=Paenibacillus fonticola TaxID=379896 RepID=UPI00037F4EFD|nr:hypothetical protein [Paenibacillus fonticola]
MLAGSDIAVQVNMKSKSLMSASNGKLELEIDLDKGEFSCKSSGFPAIKTTRSAFRWQGREYDTGHYERHVVKEQPQKIEDSFGKGLQFVISHESPTLPVLEQHFYLYEHSPFFLLKSTIESEEEIKTNKIVVMRSNSLSFDDENESYEDELNVLRVPYDNDKWVRYVTEKAPLDTESYEVTALFQTESRRGLIAGSISHDVWKTGIRMKGELAGKLDEFELYAGAAGEMTRDSQPHGHLKGKRIESPLVFVGFYEDYRAGMEAYGWANTRVSPPLKWEGSVPFGWNSWSAVMSDLDYEIYTMTSDFLKNEVQPQGFHNENTLYINFDAFWDRLTPAEMEDALKRVRQNGHKPGTYWTPFAFWGSPAQFEQPVEGTNGKYKYKDILLRDAEGEILPDIAGGLAIDPTHPGTLERIDWFTEKIVAEGFEYVKLDFMAHGALEGQHHHPAITTGKAAYHFGLSYLAHRLSPERIGRPFFINLSIAPLFPYSFAHSRRISCDVFGKIQDTEYLLNSITHGWWMNETLYRFNDPDHSVVYRSCNQESTTRHEGRSRLTASVIGGTVLLLGDDFRNEEAASRAKEWLQNQEVMDVARLGKTFIPVEGSLGKRASDVFVLPDPKQQDSAYIAVFNFDAEQPAQKTISLKRAGLDGTARYNVSDLWESKHSQTSGDLTVNLEPAESKIFKLQREN